MKTILIILLSLLIMACGRQNKPFEYSIKGTVIGQESGEFYLMLSKRMGDEVAIPFENYSFEYHGTSDFMFHSILYKGENFESVFNLIIEPGEIILELDPEAMFQNSTVIKGDHNKEFFEKQRIMMELFEGADFTTEEGKQEINKWVFENNNTLATISMVNSWLEYTDIMTIDEVERFLKGILNKELKNSLEYIELVSRYKTRKKAINQVGSKATDFRLADVTGKNIRFRDVSKGKLTYVENSGSWCGNTTRNSRSLIDIYEKYKDQGLEIITVVNESKRQRWEEWLEKEQFPWVNLVELDQDLARKGFSAVLNIFSGGNYLVDEKGIVIASNLSPEGLRNMLFERTDPEGYQEYVRSRWQMPENIVILDKDEPITSLGQLATMLNGKSFLVDCWATWCSPCFEEFKHKEPLMELLESQNMAMVYISFDRPEAESAWLNAIREQKLEGFHLRMNDQLISELHEKGSPGYLPSYMIINQSGDVMVENAYRPSQLDKLSEQIAGL